MWPGIVFNVTKNICFTKISFEYVVKKLLSFLEPNPRTGHRPNVKHMRLQFNRIRGFLRFHNLEVQYDMMQ